MAILDSEKVDFLWKRIIFGVSKTASATDKAGSNETVPSALPINPDTIWKSAPSIPASPPAGGSAILGEYLGATRVHGTADPTAAPNQAWFATATFGDVTTRRKDFVPPTFGSGYAVKVWIGDPNVGPAARIFPDTTGEEWVFDYAGGVLYFTGTIPSGKVATIGAGSVGVATHGVYFEAYRYIGEKGASVDIPFIPSLLGQLADVEDGTGVAPEGYVLTRKDGVWQAESLPPVVIPFVPQALDQLSDVETATNVPEGYVLTYSAGVWQAQPLPAIPFIPFLLGQLADVEDGTGTPTDGQVLTWKDGVWQAETLPPLGVQASDLGTMAYQNSDAVAITGGTISGVIIDGGTF